MHILAAELCTFYLPNREAVELCVYLCHEFGLDPENIVDHSEGYKTGIASNHRDVMHWFPRHGESMDTFRSEVLDGLGLKRFYRVQVGAFRDKVNAEKMLAEVKMAGFKDAFIKFE